MSGLNLRTGPSELDFLALGALVLLVVGTARGSDPVGVYALVDKVILEPNGEAAQRVQVWGAFSVATGRGEAYAPPVLGYLYFTVAQGKEDVCRREWNDLKKVAGTDQVVALGSRYEQQKLTVRRPKARPGSDFAFQTIACTKA